MAPRKPLKKERSADVLRTPTKKLTPKEADNLVRDYENVAGCTQRKLADDYDVSKSQVNRVILKRGIKIRTPKKVEKLTPYDSKPTQNPAEANKEVLETPSKSSVLSADKPSDDDSASMKSFDDFNKLSEYCRGSNLDQNDETNPNHQNDIRKLPSIMHMKIFFTKLINFRRNKFSRE